MRRLALAFAVLAGCGGDDGGPIDLEDLEPAIINSLCNLYVNCGLVEDQATCRLVFDDADVSASLIAAVEAGKVIYHEDKARECLNGIGASCERGAVSINDNSAACDETFEGTVAGGGQCAIDEECISRDCDVPSCQEACCQGTCVGDAPVPRPTVGQSCAQNGSCVDSYCDFTTTTCMPHRAAGEACTSTSQCGLNICANQVCTKRPGPGEPCSDTTLGGQCSLLGYRCSPTTSTCVPYALGGDACTTQSDCSEIYRCGDSGTCELGPRLGDTCGIDAEDCLGDSYCEASTLTCTAPKSNGASCMGDRECASDYCDFDTSTCISEPICI